MKLSTVLLATFATASAITVLENLMLDKPIFVKETFFDLGLNFAKMSVAVSVIDILSKGFSN